VQEAIRSCLPVPERMQQQQLLFLRQMQLMYEESLLLQAHPGNISQNISKEALPGKRWLLKKMSTVLF
jgi:hypothetical protein